jgi:thiol-disulfide isomerase/thioredoxin
MSDRLHGLGAGVSSTGLAVLVATLALATVAGLALRARDGRVRGGGAGAGGWALAGRVPGGTERVLLLQLSSPVCSPCRRTAALLGELVARSPELVHHEVDVAERPELAAELGVMRTPTVVAFDRTGTELLRFSGIPRLPELEAALAGNRR